MATMDTTTTHIMDEQQNIKIKSSKCWNPIRTTATLLTSNGHRICIRPPFLPREYLMESSRSPLSNGSSLITKFHLSRQQLKKQVGIGLICTGKINNPRRVISTHQKIGPTTAISVEWNSGFIRWYQSFRCPPTPSSTDLIAAVQQVFAKASIHLTSIGVLGCVGVCRHHSACIGIRKKTWDNCAEHEHLRRVMRNDQHDQYEDMLACQRYRTLSHLLQLACNAESKLEEDMKKQHDIFLPPITNYLQEVHNHGKEERDMKKPSFPLFTLKFDAPPSSEERITVEQPLLEPIVEMPLSQVDLLAVPCDKEELCDNVSLIFVPQLVNEHAISNVVLNRPRDEHHMEKPMTVFHEEGEDDVTMATTDTTIAHIMDEQQDIKIKSSKCWNPIRPPATLLTSNSHQICVRPPFLACEYLMESSRSPLSNGSSLITKLHLGRQQLKKQGGATPVMGLWACNFVWDPGPCGVLPNLVEHDPRSLLVVLPPL
uniref:Retrotransposon, putative, centromere-specific n=2 Tax=Oryza sativa subsp. japonica TaxID=39947 RepID=Q94H38_ORYSJ|nr:hypothetical protein [Oryza sativa Japonica Group]ABF97083.1 retrotransposon, putative, centromere-specific [Oryza sativa Japonica Group]